MAARKGRHEWTGPTPLGVRGAAAGSGGIRLGTFLLTTLLALATALFLVPSAQARLEFPPPQALGELGSTPQVAVDSQDRATVVWSGPQSVRLGADANAETVWDLGEFGDSQQLAVDPQGRATVVWSADPTAGGVDSTVESVRLGADGTPGAVQTLSQTGARDPQVAVDPPGRATVVWRRADPTGGVADPTVELVRLGADGIPGAVHILSPAGARDPQVAVDPQGRATVVWRRTDRTRKIQSVRLDADGVPGAVRTLSESKSFGPQVAVDSRGRSTVVWTTRDPFGGEIQSVRLGANGTAGAIKTLSKARAAGPQVEVDPRRRATVVWSRRMRTRRPPARPGGGWFSRVQAVRLGVGGARGTAHTLSRRSRSIAGGFNGHRPQVAVDSRGRATVVWELDCASCDSIVDIQARRLGADGAPGPVHMLTKRGHPPAGAPQVVVDSKGRPTVVWDREDGPIQSSRGEIAADRRGR